MEIVAVRPDDLEPAIDCLVPAFAADPITRFLLQDGPGYENRLRTFFSLLMGARMALGMPVIAARDASAIHGAAMGYTTAPPAWPAEFAQAWEMFESAIPGIAGRMAAYEGIAEACKPHVPHYYLGVIGVDPAAHGRGVGKQLIEAFCALSDSDEPSGGVYLETANPANVRFYERAGFATTGTGTLGDATLWCMFRPRAHLGT